MPLNGGVKGLLILGSSCLRWLTGLVAGHGNFRYHLKKMGLIEDDICRLCLEEAETAVHILCQCPALASRRATVLGRRFIGEDSAANLKFKDILALTRDLVMKLEVENFSASGP